MLSERNEAKAKFERERERHQDRDEREADATRQNKQFLVTQLLCRWRYSGFDILSLDPWEARPDYGRPFTWCALGVAAAGDSRSAISREREAGGVRVETGVGEILTGRKEDQGGS
jgi:hypothetical protein